MLPAQNNGMDGATSGTRRVFARDFETTPNKRESPECKAAASRTLSRPSIPVCFNKPYLFSVKSYPPPLCFGYMDAFSLGSVSNLPRDIYDSPERTVGAPCKHTLDFPTTPKKSLLPLFVVRREIYFGFTSRGGICRVAARSAKWMLGPDPHIIVAYNELMM